MLHTIQDDILKRVLDFFGLRNFVPHEYESTIFPVVLVGNLEQPQIQQTGIDTLLSTDHFTVPTGETWVPLWHSAGVVQSAGTVGGTMEMQVLSGPAPTFTRIRIPFFAGVGLGETLRHAQTLNTTQRYFCIFPPGMLLGPGSRVQLAQTGGDGSFTYVTTTDNVLCYRHLGEPLVKPA